MGRGCFVEMNKRVQRAPEGRNRGLGGPLHWGKVRVWLGNVPSLKHGELAEARMRVGVV
jgi:hypothetical protein